MIPFAIGTGARKSEQLTLSVRQCDFFRNLIIFDKTKSNRPRIVEMNSEVREMLLPLCKGKRPDDYVWLSPKTGSHSTILRRRLSVLVRMRESRA
jgi:integrase